MKHNSRRALRIVLIFVASVITIYVIINAFRFLTPPWGEYYGGLSGTSICISNQIDHPVVMSSTAVAFEGGGGTSIYTPGGTLIDSSSGCPFGFPEFLDTCEPTSLTKIDTILCRPTTFEFIFKRIDPKGYKKYLEGQSSRQQ